jgi:hypothetical protein
MGKSKKSGEKASQPDKPEGSDGLKRKTDVSGGASRYTAETIVPNDESAVVVQHANDFRFNAAQQSVSSSGQRRIKIESQGLNRTQIVCFPTPVDVLLGRGKPFQSHPGNQRMLRFVEDSREMYLQAERNGKHMIIEEVMGNIRESGGRFLSHVEIREPLGGSGLLDSVQESGTCVSQQGTDKEGGSFYRPVLCGYK